MAELSEGGTRPDPAEEAAEGSSDYTLVTFGIPVEDFALHDTLSELPAAEFECDRTIQTPDRSVIPLVWARGVERTDLEPALEADSSVRWAALVEDGDEEMLFRMEWESRLRLLTMMLAAGDSLVRDAHGTSSGWTLRVLYSARSHLSEVRALCESLDVAITVDASRQLSGGREDHYGLTRNQLETLIVTQEMGYFEIPRRVDLDTIAAELGLSHQSLSERLRRAHDALVRNTIQERNYTFRESRR